MYLHPVHDAQRTYREQEYLQDISGGGQGADEEREGEVCDGFAIVPDSVGS